MKRSCLNSQTLRTDLWLPGDCEEIQPVHPKGDQSWVFIRRTDAEAETPILWQPRDLSVPESSYYCFISCVIRAQKPSLNNLLPWSRDSNIQTDKSFFSSISTFLTAKIDFPFPSHNRNQCYYSNCSIGHNFVCQSPVKLVLT